MENSYKSYPQPLHRISEDIDVDKARSMGIKGLIMETVSREDIAVIIRDVLDIPFAIS